MNPSHTLDKVVAVAESIPGYEYGSRDIVKSPITIQEFELLKQTAGFTKDDEYWLQVAGEVLIGETEALVGKWRDAIATHPHLARTRCGWTARRTHDIRKEAG